MEPNKDLLIKHLESIFDYLAKTGHISHSVIDTIEAEYKYCNIENKEFIQALRTATNKNTAKLKADF